MLKKLLKAWEQCEKKYLYAKIDNMWIFRIDMPFTASGLYQLAS